ncbi:MAG: glycosyltransferase family 4 protein [Pseudothermotoga sp.]|nr:glycosyltransferase family 4 protein [Pseudothermotoga sp.]
MVHACDFDTVIPAFIAAKIRRKKIVFDIFDLYSEAHLEGAPAVIRKIVRSLEVFFINRTDAVVIADELRKEQLKGSKPRVLVVIYNVPDIEPNLHDLTINTGPREKLKIGYVGILQNGRMLEDLLRVVSESQDLELLIAGFGKLERKVLEASKAFDNIRFFGRVNYNDALNIYKQCDVIFAVYDPSVPNHKYSSPNKVFEAMALGKPIIVAEGTGVDQLVRSANLGFVVRYGDVRHLAEVFNKIKQMSLDELKSMRERAVELFRTKYSPQLMRHRLLSVYSNLLAQRRDE